VLKALWDSEERTRGIERGPESRVQLPKATEAHVLLRRRNCARAKKPKESQHFRPSEIKRGESL